MSIRSKALVETVKIMLLWLAIAVGVYFFLDVLGPKLGVVFIIVSMVGWFGWLAYDYFVHKFTLEEKFNK